MKLVVKFVCFIVFLGAFFSQAVPSRATPFFARTYHLSCQSCHSGYPRLNAYGLAFKANNFRFPGAEKSALLAWQKTVPLATQVLPIHMRFSPGRSSVDYTDTQLLAGGLLTKTTSFYIHHSLWIDDKPTEFPSYEVWLQQVLDEPSKLMVKFGQFELPYSYSPFIHQVSSFQPRLFGAGLQGNDVRLGAAMRGIQLSGIAAKQVRWYMAYGAPSVLSTGNAVGHRAFFGEFRDFFARVSNADLSRNVGLFVYFTNPPRDPQQSGNYDRGLRFGVDGTYHWKGWQFSLVAAYGENSDPLGRGTMGVLRTGLVEADKMVLPWLGINGRWDIQTIGVGGRNIYSDAKTLGIRVYPVDRLRLSAEYQQADHGASATAIFASVSF